MATNLNLPTGEAAARRPIIDVRDVAKSFTVNGKRLAVFDSLSCSVAEGGFLSIVGPSGCGKSTLLKLISGLDAPNGGEITFNGRKVTGPADGMIYVFQQYTKSIFPWRTVLQNIEFGLMSHKQLPRARARTRGRPPQRSRRTGWGTARRRRGRSGGRRA